MKGLREGEVFLNVLSSHDRNHKAVNSLGLPVFFNTHRARRGNCRRAAPSVCPPGSSTQCFCSTSPKEGGHRGKRTSRFFRNPATAFEMQIWATQGQETCFTTLTGSSVLLKSYCDPWLGTAGHNYWRSFLESDFISTQYWPDSAWEVNGKTQSDFNERRSRSVLENLTHSLYILSLIPCDSQGKGNNSESPRAKQGGQFYWPSWGFVRPVA